MNNDEIKARYPRLHRLVKFVLLGTDSEASSTIRCHQMGVMLGCEACSHSGLTTTQRIQQAFKNRHLYRSMIYESH